MSRRFGKKRRNKKKRVILNERARAFQKRRKTKPMTDVEIEQLLKDLQEGKVHDEGQD